MLSQYVTEGIFREHLAQYGVHVELDTEAVALEQNDGGVSVTLKHADSEKVETARFAYVVGADGARGQSAHQEMHAGCTRLTAHRDEPMLGFTRKAIGATFEGQTKEEDGSVFADVEVEGLSSDVSKQVRSAVRWAILTVSI